MPLIIPSDQVPTELIDRFEGAERIAVLCGAGLSAESGIPTFREAQTGLWENHDPMTLASPEGFARQPDLVWQWYEWRRSLVRRARPNAGHRALSALQARRPSTVLITQNVDGLQQQAGTARLLELHGNLMRSICSRTRRPIDAAWIETSAGQPPPSPHHPDGLARPDVVWFGEALDATVLEQASQAARECDLMLVVGTSGLVHPAAGLPHLAARSGALLVEINPQQTPLSAMMDWQVPEPAGTALPRLIDALRA
jgi:NAD-dependent deacetylase